MWFIAYYIQHFRRIINFLVQKLLSFSVLDIALTILEPLGPTLPLDHRSGVPER